MWFLVYLKMSKIKFWITVLCIIELEKIGDYTCWIILYIIIPIIYCTVYDNNVTCKNSRILNVVYRMT